MLTTVMWLILGVVAWLALAVAVCALLAAAKRADPALGAQRMLPYAREVVECAWEQLVGPPPDPGLSVLAALREPRPVGQVIAVAGRGAAADLVGRVLAPDDCLAARAAVTGRCELRGRAAAAPLSRDGRAIGGLPDRAGVGNTAGPPGARAPA